MIVCGSPGYSSVARRSSIAFRSLTFPKLLSHKERSVYWTPWPNKLFISASPSQSMKQMFSRSMVSCSPTTLVIFNIHVCLSFDGSKSLPVQIACRVTSQRHLASSFRTNYLRVKSLRRRSDLRGSRPSDFGYGI